MNPRCERTDEVIARLAAGAGPDEPLWAHVGDCDRCARAVSRALLALSAADEDDIALAGAGLADDATLARLERAAGLDPDWPAAGSESSADPGGTPPSARPRASRALWRIAALLLIGAPLLWMLARPPPEANRLAPRGARVPLEAELVLGDAAICRTHMPRLPPCAWRAQTQPLSAHYRAPEPIQVAIVVRDVTGDWSTLYPGHGGTAGHPACRDRFCPIDGALYDVPPGRVDAYVLFFDRPASAEAVRAWTRTGSPAPAKAHHFVLIAE